MKSFASCRRHVAPCNLGRQLTMVSKNLCSCCKKWNQALICAIIASLKRLRDKLQRGCVFHCNAIATQVARKIALSGISFKIPIDKFKSYWIGNIRFRSRTGANVMLYTNDSFLVNSWNSDDTDFYSSAQNCILASVSFLATFNCQARGMFGPSTLNYLLNGVANA